MRVAILTDFLSGLGGTETLTVRMALGLRGRGHSVCVLCPRRPADRTWIRVLRQGGVPVLLGAPQRLFPDDRGAATRAARDDALDLIAVRLAGSALHHWRANVVLANPMGPLLTAWLQWARRPAIPVVGYEFSAADRRCAHWYPPALPHVINRLQAVIAGCRASRDGVVNYHGFVGHTEVIPPLVPDAAPQPLPPEPWKLACAARLCVEKGLDYLLAALAELRHCLPQVRLHVYGEGYDRTRLDDLSRALGIDDMVTFAGRFDPVTGLDTITQRHAIFIQPSLYESIPTAMLEAAARGRVIVATRVGGIPEFFTAGGQGVLVRPANPTDIAEAISGLLARPDRLADLGQRNAFVVSQHYGYQETLISLEQLLCAVARTPTGGAQFNS